LTLLPARDILSDIPKEYPTLNVFDERQAIMTKRSSLLGFLALVILFLVASLTAADSRIDPRLYGGLAWRNIGPLRAGRVSAVTGVVGRPGIFYMGLPLGGVWKTTSAGETWYPIFDDVKEASCVGAIEVAPSDPNVIYVGMGDLITGGGINEGNGVYKSVDAGKTWQHLGLDDTKQIPSMLVDPHDPNLVLLAAQGNVHTHTEERGVFRSIDGGKTWKKTLFINNETGIQKIAWAYDRPDVILATTVRHYQAPGGAARGGAPAPGVPAPAAAAAGAAGGQGAPAPPAPTGTAIYKSTDEGLTWKEITGGGLPTLAGRTGVAVAANTNAQRMFLIGTFGLYRSDDGGATWHQMDAADRRIAGSGYICDVYVDPKNPDIVYTLNTSSYRSLDGGQTFAAFKGAPGGDDPHVLWIDPTDGQRLFLGVDQGATISLDGGLTWSSWYNQSTAQLYHISADNQYPYWVYASMQDSGSVAVRSRGGLNRPFTRLQELQANAGKQWQDKLKELETLRSATSQKINDLQNSKQGGAPQKFILSPEQQAELQKYQAAESDYAKQLRQVQKSLRKDTDSLETRIKVLNIGLMPALVATTGVVLSVVKRKRTAAK